MLLLLIGLCHLGMKDHFKLIETVPLILMPTQNKIYHIIIDFGTYIYNREIKMEDTTRVSQKKCLRFLGASNRRFFCTKTFCKLKAHERVDH